MKRPVIRPYSDGSIRVVINGRGHEVPYRQYGTTQPLFHEKGVVYRRLGTGENSRIEFLALIMKEA